MISLCKCKGSVHLLHLNCLQSWLKYKLSTKEFQTKTGVSHTIKSFNCELCKEPYPTQLKANGKIYTLLDYYVPENQSFIILESLNSVKENQYPLSVHILLFMDDASFILGRGHEADIRISDISVSRTHAKIYLKNGKYYVEDTGSKFGTLVLAKEKIEITDQPTILQIGRSLLSVSDVNTSLTSNQNV
jgi:hypothetical protein